MRLDELTWFNDLRPVDEAAIVAVEAELGVRFPDDYRAFLRTYQGAVPNQTDFHCSDAGKLHASVGSFLSVEESSGDTTFRTSWNDSAITLQRASSRSPGMGAATT